MLHRIHIQNFALIDHVELSFNRGFTVLTGETGSGKSILLGALGLLMGNRADFSLIGPNGDKSICEAIFKIDCARFSEWFTKNDLDLSEELIIRREIHTGGKSRAFVNDTPVSLSLLKELTARLFYIHSQYNTTELKSSVYQLELVDSLAGLEIEAQQFKRAFTSFASENKEFSILNEQYIVAT
jgi:DNA repair protein RecN (Recombination protein N)